MWIIAIGAVLIIGAAVYYWRDVLVEKFKGWRTVIFNVLIGAVPTVGLVLDYLGTINFAQFLTPGKTAIAGLVIMLLGIWLRTLTTGPIGEK